MAMVFIRSRPGWVFLLAGILGLSACSGSSPDSSRRDYESAEIAQYRAQARKAQEELEESRKEVIQAQQKVSQAQEEVSHARREASLAQQQSAVFKGLGIAVAVIMLVIGSAMGSKARRDSNARKEVNPDVKSTAKKSASSKSSPR